jgi:hypothetical protein
MKIKHSEACLEAHQGVGRNEGFTCTDNCANRNAKQESASYTPGPWEVCSHMSGTGKRLFSIRNATFGKPNPYPGRLLDDAMLSSAERGHIGFSWCTDNEANARLIAAAPELLDTLKGIAKAFKKLSEKYEPDSTDAEWLSHACEAIAKAETGGR